MKLNLTSIVLFSLLFLLTSCTQGEPTQQMHSQQIQTFSHEDVPANFKVAFIGDQGINNNSLAVLELIKNENASMVLHQGDFDYSNNPDAWDSQITQVLGESFPYFASIGNHDVDVWPNYQNKLEQRLAKIPEAKCFGDLGINSACQYKGIFFVLSGIGTYGADHENSLAVALNASDANWKICSWHKNQELMQTGFKTDEVGWSAFEICRESGAFIVMGHEHAYSRTHSMKNFEAQQIFNTENDLTLTKNISFAIVSGLGGQSLREPNTNLINLSWWASVYNSNYGALFCEFNTNKDSQTEQTAECYFKNISGEIMDSFKIHH